MASTIVVASQERVPSASGASAQERCAQAKAFEIMRTASQNSNLKLRDIATAIVTSVSGEPPQPHPFEENED